MRKLYKNSMNILKKGLVVVGVGLVLLSHSSQSIAAYYPFARPRYHNGQSGEIPKLKYYMLDMSNCKTYPDWLRETVTSPATLSSEEFEQMKTVLQKSITRYNLRNQTNSDFQITGQYGVQCLPYFDKKGRKQIWINGFCAGDEKCQKPATELVMVLDGGSCYFGARIRAGSKKAVSIGINGVA